MCDICLADPGGLEVFVFCQDRKDQEREAAFQLWELAVSSCACCPSLVSEREEHDGLYEVNTKETVRRTDGQSESGRRK